MTEDKFMLKIPAALLAIVFWGVCLAGEPADTKQNTAVPPADKPAAGDLVLPHDDGQSDGKHCEWACLRWEKQCNVDPRGVYKCMRVCGHFGQQCE